MDCEDIEIAADWDGESGKFFKELLDLHWLDKSKNGSLKLHDWDVHNPWASEAEKRSDKARFSRLASKAPAVYKALKAEGVKSISKSEFRAALKQHADESPSTKVEKEVEKGKCPKVEDKVEEKLVPKAEEGLCPVGRPLDDRATCCLTLDPDPDPDPDPGPGPGPSLSPNEKRNEKETPLRIPEAARAREDEAGTDEDEEEGKFEEFWARYPKRIGKIAALTVWQQEHLGNPDTADAVIRAAAYYAGSMKRINRSNDMILNPENFLKLDRWRDWAHGDPLKGKAKSAPIDGAKKAEIIAKYTNEEGQRDDRAIARELRKLEK
jgi:hypothetical protein